MTQNRVVQQVLLAGAVLVVLLLLWRLAAVLLLVFAAIIVANLLLAMAALLRLLLPVPHRVAVLICCLALIAIVGLLTLLFGLQIAEQLSRLIADLPRRATTAGEMLGIPDLGGRIEDLMHGAVEDGGVFSSVAGYTTGMVAIIAGVIIVFFGGAFIAFDAATYSRGLLKLVPSAYRPKATRVLPRVGRALRLWLLGQLAAMLVVGVATGLGLWFLDIPSAFALALIAGLFEFVPFYGAIAAYAVAAVVALNEGLPALLWVTVLFIVIQQVESNLLVPLIQQRTVDLPPALGLFSVLAFGALFGPLGIVLGAPLTVVALVAVKQFYMHDVLHEQVELPGEEKH